MAWLDSSTLLARHECVSERAHMSIYACVCLCVLSVGGGVKGMRIGPATETRF